MANNKFSFQQTHGVAVVPVAWLIQVEGFALSWASHTFIDMVSTDDTLVDEKVATCVGRHAWLPSWIIV